MPPQSLIPRRVLMTADAVGGVWRYAMDLAASLQTSNVQFLIVGVGPRPTAAAQAELRFLDNVEVVWTDTSLDWMAREKRTWTPQHWPSCVGHRNGVQTCFTSTYPVRRSASAFAFQSW